MRFNNTEPCLTKIKEKIFLVLNMTGIFLMRQDKNEQYLVGNCDKFYFTFEFKYQM
jgi:hypothetical protein